MHEVMQSASLAQVSRSVDTEPSEVENDPPVALAPPATRLPPLATAPPRDIVPPAAGPPPLVTAPPRDIVPPAAGPPPFSAAPPTECVLLPPSTTVSRLVRPQQTAENTIRQTRKKSRRCMELISYARPACLPMAPGVCVRSLEFQTSPWAAAFGQVPRGFAALAAGLRGRLIIFACIQRML
jgi:hypothetical protein